MTTSPASAPPKLHGRYKGNRRRREPPIVAECPCGWRSRPMNPKKAEKRFSAHVSIRHGGRQMSASEAAIVLQAVKAKCSEKPSGQP